MTMLDKKMKLKRREFLNSEIEDRYSENRMINAALHYASLGYKVFPLHNVVFENGQAICSCGLGSRCGKNAGKHPRIGNGYKNATTNEKIIREWWTKYPDANIGLPTGIDVGIFILDLDLDKGGEISFDDIQEYNRMIYGEEFEPLPKTLMVTTGSGGLHLYFRYPNEFKKIKSSASKIGAGLDIRANGGYVVAPPSNHRSGNPYVWQNVDTPIMNAPEWLIAELLLENEFYNSVSSKENNSDLIKYNSNSLAKIPEGRRTVYLFEQICGLVNSFPKDAVLRRALEKNEYLLEPPLPKNEIEYIVNWCWQEYIEKKNKLARSNTQKYSV